jgi:flagellin-like protein
LRRREIKMKSLRKSQKGVSDVIAVLLMIAIAVAASLIAYAWVMGYIGGATGRVGNAIQIQSMYDDGTHLFVYVQNIGTGPVTLSNIYINGQSYTPTFTPSTGSLLVNQTGTVQATYLTSATSAVTVKVVCTDGTSMSSTETVPPS